VARCSRREAWPSSRRRSFPESVGESSAHGPASAVSPRRSAFVGGFLITAVSWRLIFLINVPIAAAVIYISMRHVPETRDPNATGDIDFAGSALTVLALVGISYGLIQGSSGQWTSAPVIGALLIGIVSLVAFIVVELRVRAPIVPLDIFKSRQFSATNGSRCSSTGCSADVLPSPHRAAAGLALRSHRGRASLLPITFMLFALSSRSGALSARIGPRLQMSAGPLVVAAGLALFARINAGGNYLLEVLPAVLVFGFGLAITVAPLTATAMSSAPAERSGLASAVNNTVARTGSLLAVALLPAVAGITGDSYLHPAVFETGFQHAAFIASVICAAGPPRRRHHPEWPAPGCAAAIGGGTLPLRG